jgi:hypothetical protein
MFSAMEVRMKTIEQLDQEARNLAETWKQSREELAGIYEKLAELEDLELKNCDEDPSEAEFGVDLPSGVVLLLMEARKRMMPTSELPPPLVQVIAALVEEYLDGSQEVDEGEEEENQPMAAK